MKHEDFIFNSVNITEIYDAKTGHYLGEIEGILPTDIDELNDEELESLLKDNGIKKY